MKNKAVRVLALFLSIVLCVPVFTFGASAEDSEKSTVYMQLTSFEGLGSVPLAMVAHTNITKIKTSTSVHPDNKTKSAELTLAMNGNGKAFSEYIVSSATAADSAITEFCWNAHLLPRNVSVFGDASLEDAEGIRLWVSGFTGKGTITAQLFTSPCRGPYSSNESFADYEQGFLFESHAVQVADDYAVFDFDDFYVKDWWTSGSIYDYLDKINSVTFIFTPDSGSITSGAKIYIADLSLYKNVEKYYLTINKRIEGSCGFSAKSLVADADVSVKINGSIIDAADESYIDSYGLYSKDYSFDSTSYKDGKIIIDMFDGNSLVKSIEAWVDNKAPFINDITDYDDNDLLYGVVPDEDGGRLNVPVVVSNNDAENTVYITDLLKIDSYENKTGLTEMQAKNPAGETLLGNAVNGYFSTVSNDTEVPYQSYSVDVTGVTGNVNLRYCGKTIKNESLVLQVFNPNSRKWDNVAIGDITGNDNILTASVSVDTYAEDNEITVRVCENLVGNGSDKVAWTTDTQYYIGYSAWTHYMTEQFDWLVDEYKNDNIAYVCNTGDVVDGKGSESQMITARGIHDKLDSNGVPNGVTPGNHDVGDANIPVSEQHYDLWNKYFGAKYYNYQPWWGGGFKDNTSHYDLITVGGHDFVFLYLGLNNEATPEGVIWANKVIERYPHRTVIILTHQYLSQSGGYMTGQYGFADKIKEKIIIPNPNVKIVLCGHEPSSRYNQVNLGNGRILTEMLHDYQMTYAFVNNVGGGYGLFRYLTFGENTIESKTYSKSIDYKYDFYDPSLNCPEDYTLNIQYVQNDREIHTAYFQAFANVQEITGETDICSGQVKSVKIDGLLDGSKGWFVESISSKGSLLTKVYPIIEKEMELEPDVIKGDFDNDKEITVADALAALRIAAKLVNEDADSIAIGDIDNDGHVTVADALAILRVAAKLTNEL